MISRVYSPFKPLAKKFGIHSYLKLIHDRSDPAVHIKINNRSALRKQADTIYSFSSPEYIEIPPLSAVVNDFSRYQKIRKIDRTYEFDQPFVSEIVGGRILKNSGFCTTKDYTIILDSANSRESRVRGFYRSNIQDSITLLYRQNWSDNGYPDTYDVDTAISFIRNPHPDGTREGYSHWLQGYLTRLQGVDRYRQRTNIKPKIVIERDAPSWVFESLELFGYSDEIILWNPTEELQVNRLVVPSIRRAEEWQGRNGINYKILSKQACGWLQDEAIRRTNIDSSKFSEKVFISRGDAERRRIKNRKEVLGYLHDRGFKSYELTELSFTEQVSLFAQADEIVGVHGAGLANILFASDCTVTEIVGGSFKPTYYMMAEILDLDYRLIQGESIDDPAVNIHHQDIRIDPSLLG